MVNENTQRLSWRPRELQFSNTNFSNAAIAGPEPTSPAGSSQPQPNAPHLQTFSHLVNGVPQMPHVERIALREMLGLVTTPNGPNAPSLPNLPSGIPDHSGHQPGTSPPNIPQILAQRHQARGAAGLHGFGPESTAAVPTPGFGGPFPPGHVTTAVLSGSSQTVQEAHGPNGERWRITVTGPTHHYQGQLDQFGGNTNTTSNGHDHHPHYQNQSLNSRPRPPTSQAADSARTPEATMRRGHEQAPESAPRLSRDSHPLLIFEEYVSALEADIAGGETPDENILWAARSLLRRMPEQGASALTINRLRNHLDYLFIQADQIRARSLMRVVVDSSGAPRTRPPGSFSPIYLLSSPNGPHALLVSPYGMYSTPWPLAIQNSNTLAPSPPEQLHPNPSANPPNALDMQQAPGNLPQLLQAPQQRQQEQPNQARDLIRILLPLGGHVWLLVRLFGFVYFFTGGGGYRRALLLGFCAFAVFIVQTGIFRPFIQQAWEPLRRHVENLLPLANHNDRRQLPQAAPNFHNNNNNNPDNNQNLAMNMMLTPQQAAERMLQERQNRVESLTRQYVRRAERAIALFIASLVPGVGERHIAAREAAEAASLEAERARERAEEERLKEEREQQEGHAETSGSNDRGKEAERETD